MTMEDRIKAKITAELAPAALTLENQSHLHAGHAGDDGSGESHFHLMVVSDSFSDLSSLARHRMIYAVLKDEMKVIHALSIKALTPQEVV